MRKLPLIVIEWEDTLTHTGGWEHVDKVRECITNPHWAVGWKVKSTRRTLHITPMVSNDNRCDDVVMIPRGCIRSIRRLE